MCTQILSTNICEEITQCFACSIFYGNYLWEIEHLYMIDYDPFNVSISFFISYSYFKFGENVVEKQLMAQKYSKLCKM